MLESMGHGSSPTNVQDLVPNSGMRASPQINSSPSLLYSPASSAAPNSSAYYSIAELAPEGLTAPGADPSSIVMQQLSGGNNLASSMSAAAAAAAAASVYDTGVQTLYPSASNNLAMAAAGAAQRAVQTQALLQQQAAAVNSLSSNLSSMGLGGAGNGLTGGLEESLSGSLFAAAAAAAANSAKPVSSSLYIKVRCSTAEAGCAASRAEGFVVHSPGAVACAWRLSAVWLCDAH
jgi:hypothetical protein